MCLDKLSKWADDHLVLSIALIFAIFSISGSIILAISFDTELDLLGAQVYLTYELAIATLTLAVVAASQIRSTKKMAKSADEQAKGTIMMVEELIKSRTSATMREIDLIMQKDWSEMFKKLPGEELVYEEWGNKHKNAKEEIYGDIDRFAFLCRYGLDDPKNVIDKYKIIYSACWVKFTKLHRTAQNKIQTRFRYFYTLRDEFDIDLSPDERDASDDLLE